MAMPRVTNLWYLRSVWRRHPGTILYHIGLLMLVVVAVVNLTRSPRPQEKQIKAIERRAAAGLGTNKKAFVIDPSMPLDRVADEALAEWISLLVEKRKDLEKQQEEDGGVAVGRNDGLLKTAMDSVEVLGEGGSPRITLENNRGKDMPPHLPGDLHVRDNWTLRQREKFAPGLRIGQVTTISPKRSNIHDLKHELEINTRKETNGSIFQAGDYKTSHVQTRDVNGNHDGEHSPIHHTNRANVLIVAAMRTGSSFLGELFQQRSDFFYMFEPGMYVMHRLDSLNLTRRVMYTKVVDMLNSFYRCDFKGVSFFIELLNQKTLYARKQAIPALVTTQFCRRERVHNPLSRPKDKCDPVSQKVLETACNTRANTAIKSIRVLDINLMISAVKDPSVNLKLIHLVRDPRSMILSRLRLVFPSINVFNVTELSDTYRNLLIRYCSNWLQNYEIGHYVPRMRKNYLLVRYEDLALDPYVSARRIYDFVGLGASIPPAIQSWLDQNTNNNDPSKKRSAAFSTKRDSKTVLVSWKRRLTLEMAQAIEEVGDCTRLMKATGYKLIGSDVEMLHNSDHLVGPLPLPQQNVTAFDFM